MPAAFAGSVAATIFAGRVVRHASSIDVAVLGGGFTGLSSAYFLRNISPHKSVAVLEAGGCGNGASGRNGAMVLTMTADRYVNSSSDPSMDKRIYDLTAENVRFLSKLSAATGIDCELDTQGALQVFDSQSDLKAAQDYVAKARSLGMPVELWDSRRIAGAVGTEVYLDGFFDPGGGHIHPMKLVHVFKAAAQSAGAKIYENTAVVSVEEGREHVLRTGDGRTVRARSLVLAANAFIPGLGFLRNSILPIKEYVALTRPFNEQELLEIGWRERIPFNDSRTVRGLHRAPQERFLCHRLQRAWRESDIGVRTDHCRTRGGARGAVPLAGGRGGNFPLRARRIQGDALSTRCRGAWRALISWPPKRH
jgi:gamma-glutamylputrescine oxidase